MLHLLRTSCFQDHNFTECLALMATGDALVLLDDGCYCLNNPAALAKLSETNKVFVIDHHASARGLFIPEYVKSINSNALLELIQSYANSLTWQ